MSQAPGDTGKSGGTSGSTSPAKPSGRWNPITVPDPDHAIDSAEQKATELPGGGVQTITRIQYKNGSTVVDTDVTHEQSTGGVTTTTTDSTRHIEAKGTTTTIDSSSHTVTVEDDNRGTLTWDTTLTPSEGPPTTEHGEEVSNSDLSGRETVTTTYPGGAKKVQTTTWTDSLNNAVRHTDEYDEHGNLTDSTEEPVWLARDGSFEPKPTTSDSHDTDAGDGQAHEVDDDDGDSTDDYGPQGPVTPGDSDSGGDGDGNNDDGDGDGSGEDPGDPGSADGPGDPGDPGDDPGEDPGDPGEDPGDPGFGDGPGDNNDPFVHVE